LFEGSWRCRPSRAEVLLAAAHPTSRPPQRFADAIASSSQDETRLTMADALPALRAVADRELPLEPVGTLRDSLVFELQPEPR
jgi:hypothetical protein